MAFPILLLATAAALQAPGASSAQAQAQGYAEAQRALAGQGGNASAPISRGGARLRTITPIGRIGTVLLKLPDLPPLRCRLQWSDSYNAGVAFELLLHRDTIARWLRSRSKTPLECDITQVDVAA